MEAVDGGWGNKSSLGRTTHKIKYPNAVQWRSDIQKLKVNAIIITTITITKNIIITTIIIITIITITTIIITIIVIIKLWLKEALACAFSYLV